MEKNRQGLLHIYCGDGKGKTSAAVEWRSVQQAVA